MTDQAPLRRTVRLENHHRYVRKLVYRSYNRLPETVRIRFDVEELFHDALIVCEEKMRTFDARRARPVTFIHWAVTSFLHKRFQYETRARRHADNIEFDPAIHGKQQPDENDEVIFQAFVAVFQAARPRLRRHIVQWFFSNYAEAARIRGHTSLMRDFLALCKHHRLTYDDCLAVFSKPTLRARLRRATCSRAALKM